MTSKIWPTEADYLIRLRKAIKAEFGQYVRVIKIHGHPMQESGLPDVVLCLNGRFVALELKRPGNAATVKQASFIWDVREAGGFARIVYTSEPPEEVILWLKHFCVPAAPGLASEKQVAS